MGAHGLSITGLQLQGWLAGFYWPLLRVGAVVLSAPVLNSRQVPVRWRLLLATVLTLVIAPNIDRVPVIDPFSVQAVLVAVQQTLIGLTMGLALQVAFEALIMGGQAIALNMGLGFAQLVDPQNGIQVPVLSQYYVIIATFVFLLLNGHLMLIDLLARSFTTLPIGATLGRDDLHTLVAWGGQIFVGGLLVALPAVAALLLVNLGLGIIGRAAPQLHILAIGFPMAILLGFAIMWLSVPGAVHDFTGLLDQAFQLVRSLLAIRG
jgi:flagellar biosynthetic protein FliR